MGAYGFINYYARGKSLVKDKEKSENAIKGYMLNRLYKMFEYKNLPETIPSEMLEYYLMVNGSCFITKVEDYLYAFIGSFGGEPDPYYRPTKYIIANPALRYNKELDLYSREGLQSTEGVFMRNDILWMGLTPLMNRYAELMAENWLTLSVVDVMLRAISLISAPDDKTKLSAELYIKKLKDGEIAIIGENAFFEGVKMQSPPSNNGSYLTQFIELHQYYIGQFYSEIGLSAPYNMKRESIGESESRLSEDLTMPLIETMLQCRQEDVIRLNKLFGTNIEVGFSSVWKENVIERKLELLRLGKELNNGTPGIPFTTSGSPVTGDEDDDKGKEADVGSSQSTEADGRNMAGVEETDMSSTSQSGNDGVMEVVEEIVKEDLYSQLNIEEGGEVNGNDEPGEENSEGDISDS